MKWILLATAITVVSPSSFAWGKAGARIPLPKQNLVDAVALAKKAFLDDSRLTKEKKAWRAKCIVISVVYDTPNRMTRRENRKNNEVLVDSDDSWSWFVTFIHPEANDVSFTYRVVADGKVVLYRQTE